MVKIENLISYVNDNDLTDIYNRIGNIAYSDFNIHSAEFTLIVTYILSKLKERDDLK